MNTIKVEKDQLLGILKENREKNQKLYSESLIGYKTKAEKELQTALERVAAGETLKLEDFEFAMDAPFNPVPHYDRAIGMLELDITSTVELNIRDYQKYVEDDWEWKPSFLASNSKYGN